jgi:hypothetical protein
MNEQVPKDTLTTLDDLKRVLESVGRRPFTDGSEFTTSRLCQWESRRADAWRMAFEWRDRIHHRYRAVDVFSNAWEEIDKEHRDGMSLIREKLQS